MEEAHQRHIRIILDLVVNHTSDQHPWFIEQLPIRILTRLTGTFGIRGPRPPNNWLGCLGGAGWTFHPGRQAWYYHSFLPQQPDLNWRHPAVKQAVKDIMAFWFDKGVDGFRLDVVNLFFKDKRLRNNPLHRFRIGRPYDRQHHIYDRDQPEMHELLRELRQWTDQWPQRMLVGEIMLENGRHSDLPASYCGDNDELHLAFNFEFFHSRFSAPRFHHIIARWSQRLGTDNWPNYTLSNHDFRRHASRYGGRNGGQKLRLLALMLLTLRGTPFLYYGEETGMPEQPVRPDKMQDPVGKRYWPLHPGRDGCRRPMMWSAPQSDFSSARAWLPDEPLEQFTVQYQNQQADSLLNWYRQLIHCRRRTLALHSGDQTLLPAHRHILGWTRTAADQECLVLLNFSCRSRSLPLQQADWQLLLNSQPQTPEWQGQRITLAGHQALVLSRQIR